MKQRRWLRVVGEAVLFSAVFATLGALTFPLHQQP